MIFELKNFLKKILVFLIPILLVILLIIFFNYKLDPFSVINGEMGKVKISPNQRFLKVKHIVNNPNKYDSFLFGCSKAGKIDTRKISDGNQWYNMTYSEGVPAEFLNNIKIFIESGVQIKNIFIGIDNLTYLVSPELHKNQDLRKLYTNQYQPYLYYLFLRPSPTLLKNLWSSKKGKDSFITEYDIYNSGLPIVYGVDEYIDTHAESHINNSKFDNVKWSEKYQNRTASVIAELKEIIELCDKYKINLKFFINPMHVNLYLRQNTNEFFTFLKALTKITDFYDFSGVNSVTVNNFNYYETVHFRYKIGDEMLKVLMDYGSKLNLEPEFGQIINKTNINSILVKKNKDISDYRRLYK